MINCVMRCNNFRKFTCTQTQSHNVWLSQHNRSPFSSLRSSLFRLRWKYWCWDCSLDYTEFKTSCKKTRSVHFLARDVFILILKYNITFVAWRRVSPPPNNNHPKSQSTCKQWAFLHSLFPLSGVLSEDETQNYGCWAEGEGNRVSETTTGRKRLDSWFAFLIFWRREGLKRCG